MNTPINLPDIAGQRIRHIRRQRGMSAAALARVLGWAKDTLINFEYGRRPLDLSRLQRIAQALDVSPLALLVSDEATAETVAQVASDAEIADEVRFFLSALAAEPPSPLDTEGGPNTSE